MGGSCKNRTGVTDNGSGLRRGGGGGGGGGGER